MAALAAIAIQSLHPLSVINPQKQRDFFLVVLKDTFDFHQLLSKALVSAQLAHYVNY